MSGTLNYKSRAREVRASAQARLRALREARMAARGAIVAAPTAPATRQPAVMAISREALDLIGGGPTAPSPMDDPVDAMPSPTEDDSEAGISDLGNAMPTPPAEDPSEVVTVGPATASDPEPAAEAAPELDTPVVDPADTADLDAEAPHLPPAEPPSFDAGAAAEGLADITPTNEADGPKAESSEATSDDDEAVPDAEAPRPTDLDRLPGAGEGLIWMLQQRGIDTLADLADADADGLSADLGVVGQLLDVQGWIDFAQDQSER